MALLRLHGDNLSISRCPVVTKVISPSAAIRGEFESRPCGDHSTKPGRINIETHEFNKELDEMGHIVNRACQIGNDTIHIACDIMAALAQ
jgi:hypothetical protein